MASAPYATLSEHGYVSDPKLKSQWIFADYIAAKHSQTTIYYDQISSISYDEFKGEYDPDRTASIIQTSLEKLYKAYFDSVIVEVNDISEPGTRLVHLGIMAELVDGGVTVKLNETLKFTNGKLDRVNTLRGKLQ